MLGEAFRLSANWEIVSSRSHARTPRAVLVRMSCRASRKFPGEGAMSPRTISECSFLAVAAASLAAHQKFPAPQDACLSWLLGGRGAQAFKNPKSLARIFWGSTFIVIVVSTRCRRGDQGFAKSET